MIASAFRENAERGRQKAAKWTSGRSKWNVAARLRVHHAQVDDGTHLRRLVQTILKDTLKQRFWFLCNVPYIFFVMA